MDDLITLFKTLGDPTRLTIVKLLSAGELCNCELVELLDISQPAVSQHLAKLKAAGLVHERRAGQWVFYAADRARLRALADRWQRFLAADLGDVPDLGALAPRLAALIEDGPARAARCAPVLGTTVRRPSEVT